jgi:hypothetical protein
MKCYERSARELLGVESPPKPSYGIKTRLSSGNAKLQEMEYAEFKSLENIAGLNLNSTC